MLEGGTAPGAVIAGEAGVGKSRLATEVAASFKARGDTVVHAIASLATREMPFGAFAHLLPMTAPPANPLRWVAETVVGPTPAHPLLFVDDAHLLDPGGGAVLHHLVQSASAAVLVTLRSGEPAPDTVTSLWKDLSLPRLELNPLTARDVERVLVSALGGPVEAATAERLHRLSEGNTLFLRELVLGALDSGSLTVTRGLWRLDGSPPVAPRLRELVDARIGRLDPAQEEALELVAFGEPIGFHALCRLISADVLESLEAKQLIRLMEDRRRLLVRLAHPLYGEAIRARCPRLRAQRRFRQLAQAVEATGARRRDDTLRLGVWRLESDTARDPDSLLAACRIAWAAHDAPLAIRLGRAALNVGGGIPAALALSDALDFSERFEEAESALLTVWDDPCVPELRAGLAMRRAWNLNFGLLRPEEAERVLDEAEAELSASPLRHDVQSMRLHLRALRGEVADSLRTADLLLAQPGLRPESMALTMVIKIFGLPFMGRHRDAVKAYRHARAIEPSWLDRAPAELPKMICGLFLAHIFSGALDRADEALDEGQAVLGDDSGLRLFRRAFLTWRAEVLRLRGRVADAVRTCRDAAVIDGFASPLGSLTHAELAISSALRGDLETAREALAAAERHATPTLRVYQYTHGPAATWVAAAGGEVSRAIELASSRVAEARRLGLLSVEMTALHDLVRLGAPGRAAARLQALAADVDGELVRVCAAQAVAALKRNGRGLESCGAAFGRLGMTLFAAEAHAQAAGSHRSADDTASACRASLRASELAARCQGARTPALMGIQAPSLTPREREIARLAASGLPSRQIATILTVSIRTVDNHLQSVYGKLGVSRRSDLAAIFGG